MREHQITITLQAEQFQEIQRLARTAGARSVGTYAREKLLAAVGLNLGSKNLKATRAQDLTSVTGELRRLHRELQIFIAESLSAKDYGYVVNGPQADETNDTAFDTTSEVDTQPFTATDSSNSATLQDYGQSAREVEELAERAFIISPRLGAIDEVSDEPMAFSDPLDELLGEYDETETPAAASSLLSAMNLKDEPSEIEQTSGITDTTSIIDSQEQGEIPHSVFDAELAAFQKAQEEYTTQTAEEAQPATHYTPTTAEPSADENQAAVHDQDVNSSAQTGIQEEGSEIDFQNRPPLSGGPPPRKRRT